ncbi:exported hypothetical protein [Cupriavidus taiwanensis]|nr:exported hypothetical protein [Cupriavidus taiwanensis]SOZ25684.1 exported hypothetical protein [Cupriavidus taiwanensis]SOZ44930.1 exported hypothetical protein [Cupriavidus taiwanensis]SOZ56862.1 exported hypothetical protein [Cupriavidus taiwanensis]
MIRLSGPILQGTFGCLFSWAGTALAAIGHHLIGAAAGAD